MCRRHNARTGQKDEVDRIVCWLTGYSPAQLQQQIDTGASFEAFFDQAPALHPNTALIKGRGLRCARGGGGRPADAEDPLARQADRRTRQGQVDGENPALSGTLVRVCGGLLKMAHAPELHHPPMSTRHCLFLIASTREPGHVGNTEWLARQAAASLPPDTTQTWVHLARAGVPEFIDQRHTVGSYPMPEDGSVMRTLLDQTLACTDLVFVSPVYWFSFPATLKALPRPLERLAARAGAGVQDADEPEAPVAHHHQRRPFQSAAHDRLHGDVREVSGHADGRGAVGEGWGTGSGEGGWACLD